MFLYRTKMKEWEDSMKAAKALQAAAFKRVPGECILDVNVKRFRNDDS